ncbi:hypothetical protein [Sporomusa termitida]|uniref:Uncharacterized protein n=1 Tax=Sporomusa termitida TaxID=2377 RepID=A0A517DZ26_9FIRM|nr:hypothetical protein [Sporomusa termitida]QDR82506.1 hypothetical protein SPTER_39340 [Sporomusa termitida]
MFHETETRLRPTVHATSPRHRRRPFCRHQAPVRGHRRPGAGQAGRVVLTTMLNQAFDQYVFTRVDHILKLADTNDAGYRKTAEEVSAALDRLLGRSAGTFFLLRKKPK